MTQLYKYSYLLITLCCMALWLPLVQAEIIPNVVDDTPDSRYEIDSNNETVTDKRTGLMWKRCMEGMFYKKKAKACTWSEGGIYKFNWQDAFAQAKNSDFLGYDDWRIPNRKELVSLIARHRIIPALNINAFASDDKLLEANRASVFSSSSYSTDQLWYVNFNGGEVLYGSRRAEHFVRLVRYDDRYRSK